MINHSLSKALIISLIVLGYLYFIYSTTPDHTKFDKTWFTSKHVPENFDRKESWLTDKGNLQKHMGKDLKEVLKGQQKSPQQLGKHEMEIESHASSKEERSNKSDVVDKTGPNEHVANALNDVDQLEEQDIPYEAQLSFMVNRPLEGKILDGYLPSGWDTLESNNGFWVGCLITEAAQFGNLRNFIGSLNDVNEGVGVVVFVPKNTLSLRLMVRIESKYLP